MSIWNRLGENSSSSYQNALYAQSEEKELTALNNRKSSKLRREKFGSLKKTHQLHN